jgi:hypothetical protein
LKLNFKLKLPPLFVTLQVVQFLQKLACLLLSIEFYLRLHLQLEFFFKLSLDTGTTP